MLKVTPDEVGGFRVIGTIGEGAYGRVLLAGRVGVRTPVALKQLAPALAEDRLFLERFRQEARIMAELQDPNVKVEGVIDDESGIYVVMEFIDGSSLKQLLAAGGRLTGEQACGVLKDVLIGLGRAHALRLVHRDIKPANILVDKKGRVRLSDFGLAIRVPVSGATGVTVASAATPMYMSPEQVRGDHLDPRADIYACGALLFELLTGRPPFRAGSTDELLRMHLQAPVPDAHRSRPSVPA
ncbi:MAG: serine/threonine-protein kinase, partial [Candidatus Dormiibacterota bacterium]